MFLSMFSPVHHRSVCLCECMFVCVFVCVFVCMFMCMFVFVCVRVYKCWNAGLSSIRSVRYRTEKTNDAGTSPVPEQAKAVRHFLVRYWTEIIDAGMPIPALV
jgi:hypothetical protein